MTTPNDSSTGGPLLPFVAPAPLESTDLLTFIQNWIAGICNIDSTLVRPSWQPEPPNIPQAFTAWIGFGITDRVSDTYPYVKHIGTDEGHDEMHRHETMTLLLSFFDTGSTGQADALASLVRDNTAIPQNQEVLDLAGFALISVGQMVIAPVLVKQRWLNRIDLEIVLRREILRDYAVLNVVQAVGTIAVTTPEYGTHFISKKIPQQIPISATLAATSGVTATPS